MNGRICRCLITMAFLFYSIPASARIVHVPEEYPTIQEGIDAAENGDTVLVGPGWYEEQVFFNGKNILLTSSHGPDTTTIRGHLWLMDNEDSTCVIQGFSIVGTNSPRPYSLISLFTPLSPKIEGNIIRNNWCSIGGGIFAYGGNPLIRHNIIRDNYASSNGGGIALGAGPWEATHAEISYNIICNNSTGFTAHGDGWGGGISLDGHATIRYNVIYDNQAFEVLYGGNGGGIHRIDPSESLGFRTVIENNTIVNNVAQENYTHGRGGGIYLISFRATDSLIIRNNIFAYNFWGGEVEAVLNDSMYFYWDYNLVYDSSYSGFDPGPHDLFLDPMFVDTLNDDFHLLPDSPCIDAGDPESPLDPDSSRADIGALFFDHRVDIDNPGETTGPYRFQLHQNYPNPFNSQTIISYHLKQEAVVSLHIFSITGHLVKALANKETQAAGEHRYVWDGRDKNREMVSTGIYFYELYVDDYRESKAMIMIK